MITPQEIREKTFEKAVFGGYDMGSVDDFISELAADYTTLSKDNAILKSKLKVLVEKVEEYRATEDAMRLALLSAQKTGSQIEDEAREKARTIISDAETEAADILKDTQLQLAEEEERLEKAKQSSAQFIANMQLICNKQLDFLSAVVGITGPAEPTIQSQPVSSGPSDMEETVKTIESSVARAAEAQDIEINIDMNDAPAAVDEPTRTYSLFKDLNPNNADDLGIDIPTPWENMDK